MLSFVSVLLGSRGAWNQTLTTAATVSEIQIHWAETLRFLDAFRVYKILHGSAPPTQSIFQVKSNLWSIL